MLVDLRPKQLTGKAAEASLGRAGITCNKNGVPFDTASPMLPQGFGSGRRRDLACFGIAEFKKVGELIAETLDGFGQERRAGQCGGARPKQAAAKRIDATLPGLLRSQIDWRQDRKIDRAPRSIGLNVFVARDPAWPRAGRVSNPVSHVLGTCVRETVP